MTAWQWIRLCGTWWGAEGVYGEDAERRAEAVRQCEKSKADSEARLSAALNEGWTIHTIVPVAPNGIVTRHTPRRGYGSLTQEVWTVFLTKRDIAEPAEVAPRHMAPDAAGDA
jgi:hypothetical protein